MLLNQLVPRGIQPTRLADWSGQWGGCQAPTVLPGNLFKLEFIHSPAQTVQHYQNMALRTMLLRLWIIMLTRQIHPLAIHTRAISINLDVAWSDNPGPTQQDLQGLMTHEFGHVLGLGHVELDFCGETGLRVTCSAMPNRETMQHFIHPGETCNRTLESNDVYNANYLY